MSKKSKSKPTGSQEQATNKGVSVELSQEIVIAIADYLDILIEMDLCQKQLNQGDENGTNQNSSTSGWSMGKTQRFS